MSSTSRQPMISIIMGVYNSETIMDTAIRSIKEQTYANWEFVICDDGSVDGTYKKLLEIAEEDPRFIILRNDTNRGLAYTMNHCISMCNGEFIARMDADDFSYPERLQVQLDYLNKHPEIAFVSSSVDIFDGNAIIGQRKLKEFPQKIDLIYNTMFVHPATLFREEALRSVGGYRVAEETRRGQDYDLFMRMYGAGLKGANLQKPVYRYTEDAKTIGRRTLKARQGEVKIRIIGYKSMGVLWWAFPFLLKPYVAHLIQEIKIIIKRN